MSEPNSEPPFAKEIESLMSKLDEHCDSIRIFITVPEGNGASTTFTLGKGSFLAQYGQVREWIIAHEARVAREAIRDSE